MQVVMKMIFRRVWCIALAAAMGTMCFSIPPAQARSFLWEARHEYSSSRESAAVGEGMSVERGTSNFAGCQDREPWGYPVPRDPAVAVRSYDLCRAHYASMFDPEKGTPLWVAEYLTRDNLQGSNTRAGLNFKPDPQVPANAQAASSDYSHSGFDKGHMAPAEDFIGSPVWMEQSFMYTNAVPENPTHNRGIWANLEGSTREIAARRQGLFVITGPVFSGPIKRLSRGQVVLDGNGTAIPDAIFKVLFDPHTNEMTGFIIPNQDNVGDDPARFQVTVRAVESATGLNFNPALQRGDADRLETNGGNWLIPHVRIKFRN